MALQCVVPTGHKTFFFSNIVLIITVIISPFTFFKQYVTISIIKGILISCLTVHMSS
jgi:hypothetical protein